MSYRHPRFVALLAVALLSPTSSSFAQACLAPYPGITNWWMGDSSVADVVGARDASLNNGASFADGFVSQAFALDGVDDFVSVAHDPALDFGEGNFGVNFWVNFDDTTGDQVLVEKYVSSGTPSGWSLVKSSSGTLILTWPGGSYEASGFSLDPGTWHHMAISRDGTFARVFVDRVVSMFPISGDLSSTSSLKFGHRGSPSDTPGSTDSSGLYLHGRIDEVLYSVGIHTDYNVWDVYDAGNYGVCAPVPACGNGRLEGSEICDDGNGLGGDGCENNCVLSCAGCCGNGIADGAEQCDDGNNIESDDCRNACVDATCGDGVVHVGVEVCDDGNANDTDDCRNTCVVAVCGDGALHVGVEVCDDGNAVANDGCENDCTSGCGNGVLGGAEQCDDGNGIDTDACPNGCVLAFCGDGFVHAGVEACDDGNPISGDGCDVNCTSSACGNGIAAGSEDCDDGNTTANDGCENDCTSGCGNGVLGGAEQCDDGNDIDTDSCRNGCVLATCGDGIVHAGVEACDDGNMVSGDGCDGNCTSTGCGNGIVTGSEDCDDGNMVSGDGCDSNCSFSRCGNGVIGGSEVCDDGNQESGDGCDSNCTPTGCGNGVWSYGETCDDGNLVSADGCESDCSLTPGVLDPTFDFDGVALGSEADEWEPMYVALQADGRIIAAYTAGGAAVSRFGVTRYHTDGTLDSTFGTAGVAVTAIGLGDAYVRSMAVQPDGKIVVAGRSDDVTSDRITLARYLADGALDPTFGTDGIVVTRTASPGSHVEGVAVATDGSIVITGGSENENLLVGRYSSSGALDPAFGGGIVVDPLVTVGTSVAVQPDGRIVTATGGDYEYGEIVVSRFRVDGSIDVEFGVDGRQVFPVGTERRSEVALQPDGKIVVAGQARATASLGIATLRLNSDGSRDASYDGDGISVVEPTTGDEIVGGLAIGADSAITVTGLSDHGGYSEIALVRFRADGSPDPGVLGTGWLGTTLGQDSERGYDVVLQPDGKAVVVAETTESGPNGLAVLRFLVGTCGDLRAQIADGEQCDDGNASNGDGCENDCTMTPVVQSASAGGSVTTDPLGQGATESSPLQTSLTTPNAGTVSIAPVAAEPEPVAGFQLVGIALEIEAPPATPQAPLSITLTVDPSALPPGTSADHLEVLRDGVAIEACTGPAGTASPDPCIEERTVLVSGDIQITILTSHASLWAMALRGLLDGEQACVNAVGKAAVGVAKAQSKLNDGCLKAVAKGETTVVAGCLLADTRGKVEAASEKLEAASFELCTPPPPFGFGDAMLAGEGTRDAAIGLVADLLGSDVDSGVATDSSGAKCQAGVLKSMEKLFGTQAKLLLDCTEEGLAGGASMIVSAEDLASCIESVTGDPKAAKGVAKLAKSIDSKCGGDSSQLPGSCAGAGHVGACLGHRVSCRLCAAFRAAWGLGADCDEIDNSIPDSSCE